MSTYRPTRLPVYRLMQALIRLLVRHLVRLEADNLERMPAEGPVLLVINHLGLIDPLLVLGGFDRRCRFLVGDTWRRVPVLRELVDMLGGIWVARGEADPEAIKAALGVLKQGLVLGVAPEGTRSKTGGLQPGKLGPAYLASRAQVPILPVVAMGTERFGHNLIRLRRTPVRFIVGEPFRLPGSGRARTPELQAHTEEIMLRLAALLEPQYRGVYADHPRLAEFLPR